MSYPKVYINCHGCGRKILKKSWCHKKIHSKNKKRWSMCVGF